MKLRGKLLLVSLCLLVLPWAGWQFLRLMGDVLREGQEEALVASAEALARGLTLRSSALPPVGPSIFARRLSRPPRLDGRLDDWGDAPNDLKRLGDAPAGASLMLGNVDDAFYLFVDVADLTHQRSDAHWPIVDRRDHVRLTLHGRQGVVQLRLANRASGALIVTSIDGGPAPLHVVGEWRETDAGYAIEMRLPQGYTLRALELTVQDADENDVVRTHTTAQIDDGKPLSVLARSETLTNSMQQLVPTGMRARLFDRDGWLVAETGALSGSSIAGDVPAWRRWLYNALLFAHAPGLAEDDANLVRSDAVEVEGALAGVASTFWRRDVDNQRLLLSAAVPLRIISDTRAVLLLERESDALLRLTDRAFSGLFAVTLLALLAAVGALFLFAGRLSGRIRRLRDAAENALDRDGRVRAFPVSKARDEIGDLSRSFATLLSEVGIYTGYLRGLAGKLSHEINTPIAIVRTSLENLEADPGSADTHVYLERARSGIERLGALVRAMSEAGRIEQAIEAADAERIDLRRLVADCADGYRPLLAPRELHVELPARALPMRCAPDLIAQALDKLIDNARGFCPPDGWVRIVLVPDGDGVRLSVANSGPPLPEAMRDKLFDSLVSVREKGAGGSVHLGFGLYVVKLIIELHHGQVMARNLPDAEGVEFILDLRPLR